MSYPRKTSTIPYLIAVAFLCALIVAAVLAITWLRPQSDNAALIATVIGALLPTTAAIGALIKSSQTQVSVNGRLDAFVEAQTTTAYTRGLHEGRAAAVTELVGLQKKNAELEGRLEALRGGSQQ